MSTFDSATLWSATSLASDETKLGAAGLSVRHRKLLAMLSQPSSVADLAQSIALPVEDVRTALERFAKLGFAQSTAERAMNPMETRLRSHSMTPPPSRLPILLGVGVAVLAAVGAGVWLVRGSSPSAPAGSPAAKIESNTPAAPVIGPGDSAESARPNATVATAAGAATAAKTAALAAQAVPPLTALAVTAPAIPAGPATARPATLAQPAAQTTSGGAAAPAIASVASAASAASAASTVAPAVQQALSPVNTPSPSPAVAPTTSPALALATTLPTAPPSTSSAVAVPAAATPAPATTAAVAASTGPATATVNTAAAAPAAARAATPREIKLVNRVEPTFPRGNEADKGSVRARLQVDARGAVTGVDIVEATPPRIFDRTVRTALQQWRYEPTGEPFSVIAEINFSR